MSNDLSFGDDGMRDEPTSLGFTKELMDEINEQKVANPGMFVSAWQEDEMGIEKQHKDEPLEDFLTAAEEGDLEKVASFLKLNPTMINAFDEDGYTALHRAAYNNHIPVIDFLLKQGADAEARTNDGWTPLLSAANWANFEVIGCLLSHGVDPNALSHGRVSALHLAIQSKNEIEDCIIQSVRYLLQAPGIIPDVVSGSGDKPIDLAHRSSRIIYEMLNNFINGPL
ncbi:unnamed protein product [Auanema sp. JU1783]|nr:unnamed protein product [Auanema sp. JU1783]